MDSTGGGFRRHPFVIKQLDQAGRICHEFDYAEISQMWGCERVEGKGTQMLKHLDMSQPWVAYSVRKGERIVRDKNLQMTV